MPSSPPPHFADIDGKPDTVGEGYGSTSTTASSSTTLLLLPAAAAIPKLKPKMPWAGVIGLALFRAGEPIAFTSVFPYVPMMVELLGIPKDDVGTWAGAVAGIFSFTQVISVMFWTQLSERVGRKPIILLGLISTIIFNIAWGLSTNMGVAIVARSATGLFNGNSPIFKTAMSELVPDKSLQPLAFSILPAVYDVGTMIGPWIGGSLANPHHMKPGQPSDGRFLSDFPFFLPSAVVAAVILVSMIAGYLSAPETHPAYRDRPDSGIILRKKIERIVHNTFYNIQTWFVADGWIKLPEHETVEDTPVQESKKRYPLLPFMDALNAQTGFNIAVHATMALHLVAIIELLPVFMHRERNESDSDSWFRFSGGLGYDTTIIGRYFAVAAVFTMIFRLVVYPSLIAKRFSLMTQYRASMWSYPVLYLLFPLTVHVPRAYYLQHIYLISLWVIKCMIMAVAFPTAQILITSASTENTIATLNSITTIAVSIGRTIGPISSGYVFSIGVRHSFAMAAFLYASFLAVITGVVCMMVKFKEEEEEDETSVPVQGNVSSDEEDQHNEDTPLLRRPVS